MTKDPRLSRACSTAASGCAASASVSMAMVTPQFRCSHQLSSRIAYCSQKGWVVVFVASYFSSTDVSMSCAQLTIMIARRWFIN
jgi:hypothetical protein